MTNANTAALSQAGVSIWLDDLSRELTQGGGLQQLVDERSVVGVTSNPTIFASALAKGERYTDQVKQLVADGASVDEVVNAITTTDVRDACDLFAPVFERTGRVDGRVSLEVDPRLSHQTQETVGSARSLWATVDRPNLLIKIPATVEGLPAITTVVSEGISVNVTLIFSLDRYRGVMNAYLTGLEQAREKGLDLSTIASVASFFVSRVDSDVDSQLDAIGTEEAKALKGRAGLANARLAYSAFEEVVASPRWKVLAEAGATVQRPLWASTGTKDPSYPDTLYVTGLVTRDVVNTMPGATLDAVADHGSVDGDTVRGAADTAGAEMDALERLGVSYAELVERLEVDGLDKFEKSWRELGETVSSEMDRAKAGTGNQS